MVFWGYFVASGAWGRFHGRMQWYYAIDGQRFGPVSHSELEQLVQDGTIVADTLLWRPGMNEWQTLAAIRKANPSWIAEVRKATPDTELPVIKEDLVDVNPAAEAAVLNPDVSAVAVEPTFAGFWPRAGAYLVDFFIWWFVWQIMVGIVGSRYFPEAVAIAQHGAGYQPKPEELMVILRFLGASLLIGLVWSVIYDALFMRWYAATPGKLIFGLRVVLADGSSVGFVRTVARSLAKWLTGFTLGVGYLVAAFDEHKRGLHDFLCNTRVVKIKRNRL